LPVLQGYGMTEASPVISVNVPDSNVPESVGAPLDNVEVKIAANGELLARGPSVMKGYWNNPEASAKSLDGGWLHTGDLAENRGREDIHTRAPEGRPRALERREAAAAGRRARDPRRPDFRAGHPDRRGPAVF